MLDEYYIPDPREKKKKRETPTTKKKIKQDQRIRELMTTDTLGHVVKENKTIYI